MQSICSCGIMTASHGELRGYTSGKGTATTRARQSGQHGKALPTLMKGPQRRKPCARPISTPRSSGDTPRR